jgi:hypothetical protein
MKIVWLSGNMVPIWTLGQNTRSIPIISDGNWEKLIGIHIHGDGCEFYKEDEYFVWSWSSIFSTEGSIKDVLMSRFPIAVIPERWMRKSAVTHRV